MISLVFLYISNSQNLSTKYIKSEFKLNKLQYWSFVKQQNLKGNVSQIHHFIILVPGHHTGFK